MGPLLVAFAQSGVGQFAHLLDGFEDAGTENLIAVGHVEALNEGVPSYFARQLKYVPRMIQDSW